MQLPLLSWAANSIVIALLAAGLVVLSSALVAFGFAYFPFPGRKLLFGLVLATMMLPGAVTMVPQYLIWLNLGLVGTWVPLFGANLFGSAFYIFLQRQFFLGLPRELFEAARVDGASYLAMFATDRPAPVDPVAGDHLLVRVPGQLEQPAGRPDLPERRLGRRASPCPSASRTP